MAILYVAATAAAAFFFGYLALVTAYIVLITIGAWLYRRRFATPLKLFKIAIIVPAHNEQDGIGRTLDDLLALDYPRNLYDIYVVADNCSDSTAAVAAERGAFVRERRDLANRGKGQALDWLLRTCKAELEQYDLIAFVDADMQIDSDFLRRGASSFVDDQQMVVQARYTMSPRVSTWRGAVGFASFAYVNHVRPAGKCFWGGTAELKGGGMIFRSELILETGWPVHSIAEDFEFGKELLLRGIKASYEPGAIVTSEIPSTLGQIEVQQSRWEGGKLKVLADYFPRILKAFLHKPSMALLDALFDLLVPPLSLVLFVSAIGAAIASLTNALNPALFLLPILAFGAAVIVGLVHLRAPKRVWLLLSMAPIFVLWKLLLLGKVAIRSRETEWKRTPRDLPR